VTTTGKGSQGRTEGAPRAIQGHLENLETVFKQLGVKPHDIECDGVKGLKKQLDHAVNSNPSPELLNTMIAGGVAKTEHYEVSAYSGMIDQAKFFGHKNAKKLLGQNLKQEE